MIDADERAVRAALCRAAALLFRLGWMGTHSGNLSVRLGGSGFLITPSGHCKADLSPEQIVAVPMEGPIPESASVEAVVHRAVYAGTPHRAVCHTHSPYAVVLSLTHDEVIPVDAEGRIRVPSIPVVRPSDPVGSAESARMVSESLGRADAVLVGGHGPFCAGSDLESAFRTAGAVEGACRVLYLLGLSGRGAGNPA